MSLAIIDAREWQKVMDLKTGRPREDDSAAVRLAKRVLARHPFPGDIDARGNRWVTDTALDLVGEYDPRFVFLIYAQQYYACRFSCPPEAERARLIDAAFAEAERFARATGFYTVVVGTGDMTPTAGYIDLSGLDGLAVTSHWLTRYCGLYGLSGNDGQELRRLMDSGLIERVAGREEFLALFGGAPADAERLPDCLAVAREGYCFRSTLLRRPLMVPARNEVIPVAAQLAGVRSLTDISGRIREQLANKKVALILVEGVGVRDFRLPYEPCVNRTGWYTYEPGEGQYLTISTGRHQVFAYPPGYKSYREDDETKEYPLSGYFTAMPSGTLGGGFAGRSIAVGNRSMFMHTVPGADIAIECFARNLYNQGCLAVVHRQDK
jgi:hypothetical protein